MDAKIADVDSDGVELRVCKHENKKTLNKRL